MRRRVFATVAVTDEPPEVSFVFAASPWPTSARMFRSCSRSSR